ncbi:unnamed protein product [Penicillium salamii]|uniref:Uncharacterized protein n=1 Tax=Penicillium salamii TaxID=1612424 RepID=A0A9W4K0C9_9EURO|nr:unnamed protein product [Penicillium salamii]CAG8334379.1 unnamed protein product [Penicillium salamii]CAG8397360.1 unnamed protein product [Penicillium salamii]CAG8411979.1 unnamed protein product [Penicillium salamii]CAG8423326.1 unnamed protein product [Penicillium salamii]
MSNDERHSEQIERPPLVSALSESGRRISSQHVRFSTDIEREEERQTRPTSRGLSINTALAPPTVPTAARSPTSPLSPPNAQSTLSPISPVEPAGRSRSRNRGYSLRRSIFNKTITSTEAKDDLALAELGEAREPEVNEKHELSTAPTTDSTHKEEVATYVSSEPSEKAFKDLAQERWAKKNSTKDAAVARIQAALTSAQKFILRIKDIPPTKDGRHLDLNPSLPV